MNPNQTDRLNGASKCTKMLSNLSEKLETKFPAITLSYSMVKIARLDDAFSEIFELEASPVEGRLLQQKDKKREKGKAKQKQKIKYPKSLRA